MFSSKLAMIIAASVTLVTPATPIAAASPEAGSRFTVEATVPSAKSLILRDAIWQCFGNACYTPSLTARPTIVCEAAARKFGKIISFVADGVALTEEQLAKCNRKAK